MSPKDELIERIVELQCEFFDHMFRNVPTEWAESDLTMPQLKTLMQLVEGPARMSEVAERLNVSMPTATGIVDRLSNAGLVTREHDGPDRRVVLCGLTELGRRQATAMWNSRNGMMKVLLGTLPEDDLNIVLAAITKLRNAARTLDQQPESVA